MDTDALIDAWFRKHFHNIGLGLDVEVYNRIHAAKDDLKRILRVDPPTTASEAE